MNSSENHASGVSTHAQARPGEPLSRVDQASSPRSSAARQVTFGVGLSNGGICLVGVPHDVRSSLQTRWADDDRRKVFEYPGTADFWSDLRRLESVEPIACCAVVSAASIEAALAEVVAGRESLTHAVSLVLLVPRASTPEVVRAMQVGIAAVADDAADLELLVKYVEGGLNQAAEELLQRVRSQRIVSALRELSDGERSVMLGILSGKLNKEIAQEMSLSVRTIEQRRREVFRKVGVHHPASLGREVTRAFLSPRLRPADRDYVAQLMELVPGWKDAPDDSPSPSRSIRIDSAHSGPSRANS